MLEFLYFTGQVLCLVGLAYGAFLTLRNSEMLTTLGHPSVRRRRTIPADREAREQDPHGTELGYWP